MKSFNNNHKLGSVLAIIGILVGFLAMILIAQIYIPVVEGKILDLAQYGYDSNNTRNPHNLVLP